MKTIQVLIVEDEVIVAMQLKRRLTASGYKVTVRNSAESALGFIHQSMPDLLILDIQLGGISGFQLCEMFVPAPHVVEQTVKPSSPLVRFPLCVIKPANQIQTIHR